MLLRFIMPLTVLREAYPFNGFRNNSNNEMSVGDNRFSWFSYVLLPKDPQNPEKFSRQFKMK
jgi:hypothetical protein